MRSQQFFAVLIIARVKRGRPLRQAIKRRHGDIKMTLADEVGHLLVEKRHQQGGDMCTVDIGISHDDDFFIAEAAFIIRTAHAAAQRQHQIGDLLALLHFRLRGIGDIEDFPAQRKNGLVFAIAALLGRATGAVALNDENLCALA